MCGKVKRILSIVLLFVILLCMTACGREKQQGQKDVDSSATRRTEEDTVKKDSSVKENTDILVAYFSCTGTTKPLAEYTVVRQGIAVFFYSTYSCFIPPPFPITYIVLYKSVLTKRSVCFFFCIRSPPASLDFRKKSGLEEKQLKYQPRKVMF